MNQHLFPGWDFCHPALHQCFLTPCISLSCWPSLCNCQISTWRKMGKATLVLWLGGILNSGMFLPQKFSMFCLGKVQRNEQSKWQLVGDCKSNSRDVGKFLANFGFQQAVYSTCSKPFNPIFLYSCWLPAIGSTVDDWATRLSKQVQ